MKKIILFFVALCSTVMVRTQNVPSIDEIWYNSADGNIIVPSVESIDNDNTITSNDYDTDKKMFILKFSKPLKTIWKYAFMNQTTLKSIVLPNGISIINEQAFDNCTSLLSIEIPNSVTEIDKFAFDGCISLTSIEIPYGITKLGSGVFDNCQAMSSVTFKSLPLLTYDIFGWQDYVNSITVDLTDSEKPYIGTSLEYYSNIARINYHRSLEPGKWGTIILPFTPTSSEGLAFYELKEMNTGNDGTLTFTKADNIVAGKPYLFKNTSSTADFTLSTTNVAKTDLVLETGAQDPVNGYTMKGIFQQVQLDGVENANLYYLKDNGFYHANGKINIAPFRAYIEGSEVVQAKSFMLVVNDNGEDITAVPGIMDKDGTLDETEGIYDLNGRKFSAPQKGQVNIIRLKSGKTIKSLF